MKREEILDQYMVINYDCKNQKCPWLAAIAKEVKLEASTTHFEPMEWRMKWQTMIPLKDWRTKEKTPDTCPVCKAPAYGTSDKIVAMKKMIQQ